MAGPSEIPQLVSEFVEMAKAYLKQETVDPAKRLGRAFGFGLAAGALFFLAAILLSVVLLRVLLDVMPGEPSAPYWSSLAYVLAALGLVVVIFLLTRAASR